MIMKIWCLTLIGLIVSNISLAQTSTLENLGESLEAKLSSLTEASISSFDKYCLQEDQVSACLTLGRLYDFKKEEKTGEKYYLKACQLKSAQGCLLGGYNLERQGYETRSNDLYLLGCLQTEGGGQNCVALAQNYREQRNWTEALKYFEMGCNKDIAQGCYFAQEIYNYVKHNPRKWKYLLTRGCKLGHGSSCYKLAYYAQSYDDKSTARWGYKEACTKDILEACEEFRIINEGGVGEKWWQKNKIIFTNIKDRSLFFLEQIFPIGPR
jgi:hypothetical protein